MIPATISPDNESKAEAKLFFALKKSSLDDSYFIFHSLDILSRNLQNKFIDGEVDFLIFCQRFGLLAVEVKGGVIKYDGAAAQWFQNNKPLEESPYHQAMKNKFAVSAYLQRQLGKKPSLSLGHAACFPDVFTKIANVPAEAAPEITITGTELNYLEVASPSIMDHFSKQDQKSLNKTDAKYVRETLTGVFEYGASLVDLMGQAEHRVFRLTEEQYSALDTLYERKKALIKGYAGTGKTILAIKKAKELAQEGKKVLILCFNKLLGEYLKKSIAGASGDITAATYHAFCLERLREAGIVIKEQPHNPEIYYKDIPDRFDQLLKKHPLQYDAIIVDEGQDFMSPYWITIEQMLAPDGYFYIFYDPYQNIHKNDLDFPVAAEPLVLNRNCRNTRHIAKQLTAFIDCKMKLRDDAPEGVPVEEKWYATDHERRKELSRILHTLILEEHIPKERIVILGNHSIENTCLKGHHQIGNFIVEQDPDEGSQALRYHTIWKFKGCEADAVILLDVDKNEDRWTPQDIYTAMSRANILLYVLYKDQQIIT
jgi:DNA-binding transcriptional ArsR family regulator